MLYSEFVEGTGCAENDYNYKVYKDLEVMYMNSDLTKSQIYEYGKKLVNNEKPTHVIELENQVKAEIKDFKDKIVEYRKSKEYYRSIGNTSMTRYCNEEIKRFKHKIEGLKWVLGA